MEKIVNNASIVYRRKLEEDDFLEIAHELTKLYSEFSARDSKDVIRLFGNTELQKSSWRVGKEFPGGYNRIPLPEIDVGDASLEYALKNRRTSAKFSERSLSKVEIGTILFSGNGIVKFREKGPAYRTIPSGGALYPTELYISINNSDEVEKGTYYYAPLSHELVQIGDCNFEENLRMAYPYNTYIENTSATVFITSVLWRSRFKYNYRGYRFALLEAGSSMQNILLVANGIGISAIPLGGFYDDKIESILGIDGVNEVPLCVIGIGGKL